jgi:hypothetical protein
MKKNTYEALTALQTCIIKRPITANDLPLEIYYTREAREPITINGQLYPQSLHEIGAKLPENIPKELEHLTIGTIVYFVRALPLESQSNPENNFVKIQLSKKSGSTTFEVHTDCFEYKKSLN